MNNFTEIVFILDRSGSMGGLESSTIKGFNDLVKKQKREEGKAIISTVLFDSDFEVLHNRLDLQVILPLTTKEYYVRGSTALLDAIGRSIYKIDTIHRRLKAGERPDKTMFVIITDGYENASTEFTYKKVSEMISLQKEVNQWEFLFLGANIDAEVEAKKFGIDSKNAVNYHADELGTKISYDSISDAIHLMRRKQFNANWRVKSDLDYHSRIKPKK